MYCIFCKIISGEIPSDFIYRDEEIVAFRDIHPQAPTHVLIVPKKHIPSLTDLKDEELALAGKMIGVANKLAKQEGVSSGYKVVINTGRSAGQVVPHLHMHLLGGRRFK